VNGGTASGSNDKRPRLSHLGGKIASHRKQMGLSQERFGELIGEKGATSHTQSFVARLENGLVIDPDQPTLEAIGSVLDIEKVELIADIICDKYNVSTELLFPLYRKPIKFDEIAKWESADHHLELWVCTTAFVDNQHSNFRRAVKTILTRPGGSVTFFVPESLFGDFALYRCSLLDELNRNSDDTSFLGVPLPRTYISLLAGSYAIANPDASCIQTLKQHDRTRWLLCAHRWIW
jgi:transcriptional regulator with XRE-family HTH domain